ncbi:MAG: hypothetical protein CFE27_06600 [Alphaproteobacteria bacterium PA1]|nr:MAG: hypothetical protein CFE27_06600 [Alphaproteobacteria bacterium PA1]
MSPVGVSCSIAHNPTTKIPAKTRLNRAVVVVLDQVADREPDKRDEVSVMNDRGATGFDLEQLLDGSARCSRSYAKLEQRELRNLASMALFLSNFQRVPYKYA